MKMNPKISPWLPIIGVFTTLYYKPEETGLNKSTIFYCSAFYQATTWMSIILLIAYLKNN